MMTLWGRKNSSNVQTVVWCLEELNLPYKRIDAGFTYGVVDTEEYRKINPNSTVPTFKDGEGPALFESCAIARYLASNYAPDAFWPSDPSSRAQVDMWAEWSKHNIATAFSLPLFWPIVRLDPALQNPEQLATALEKLSKNLDIANDQLSRSKYLASNELTLADIVFGHSLFRYYDINLNRPEHKHVRAYYERLTQSKTYQKSVMIPYDDLRYKP